MLILFLIVIFTFVVVLRYIKEIKTFKNLYDFSKTIPGPPLLELSKNTGIKLLPWFEKLQDKYGSTFGIWLGKEFFVFISDVDDVKTVLSSNNLLYKSNNHDLLRPWLGNGLVVNGGRSWFHRRKLLTPAFHFKVLGSFKEPIDRCCDIMINRLMKVADGQPFDIYPYITLHALDAISETAMGVRQHVQEEENSSFVVATKTICKLLHQKFFTFWMRLPYVYNFTKNKRETEQMLDILHSQTRKVIEQRRKTIGDEDVNILQEIDKDEFGFESKKRLAFLDMLLLSQMKGSDLSDKDIQEEVDTFMFEGHDTVSSAMSFTIYELSQHPDVQKKAYEESLEFEGRESETMKYLEAVLKETMRIYPSVPIFSRKVTEPMEIGGRVYTPGCNITVCCYLSQRNPNIFTDPNTFKPDRFLNNEDYHPYSFVSFSAGPRNCIGQKYAMLELKSTLAKLLRTFEFLPVENFKPILSPEIILKSSNGIPIRLKKR